MHIVAPLGGYNCLSLQSTSALEVKPLNPVSESVIVMIDELWHLVSGKKQNMDLENP
ncbi:MAG: hypothetical protein JSS34_02050 [Proteobacteria bacterium]|nr:hypothetical protein [Pseudomonadota bacterium]